MATEISLAARIIAVADAFDVMTAARSYKDPLPAEAARAELVRCAGTQFDDEVVRAFVAVSIGKLRRVMGPSAALAQIPVLGSLLLAPTARRGRAPRVGGRRDRRAGRPGRARRGRAPLRLAHRHDGRDPRADRVTAPRRPDAPPTSGGDADRRLADARTDGVRSDPQPERPTTPTTTPIGPPVARRS